MAKILLISANAVFAGDLKSQLERHPDWEVREEYDSDGVFDAAVVDDDAEKLRSREPIKLTERETAILKYLYKAGDKIVGKAELLAEVWGYNPEATTHTVETHIYRLRQKIERPEQVIMTEDNGYRLKKENA